MELEFHNGRPVVSLRVFRAVDEPETCLKFIKSHKHVLANFNLEMVTSAKNDWVENPAVFVIVAESLDGRVLYGGVRIQVANGVYPLPIEGAIGKYDNRIYELVKQHGMEGTGEGCGLWNSRAIAGYGIGSIFLTQLGVAIAPQIGIKTLFGLCAPYTVKLAEAIGYRVDMRLGNQGHFYYPRDDFEVTSMFYKNVHSLEMATPEGRDAMFELRNNLYMKRIETLRKKEIEIHYDIAIPNIDKWNIGEAIENLIKMGNTGK